uniref:Uncharacterized protein n=1 Tax=Anopheles albimanus TaxID=7167 RepID=A0A182FGP8_ANOAL
STDSASEDESATSESSSDELSEVDSSIRWSKRRRSFADRGGGDADVTYDSDWSTDTVIVNRSFKKEPHSSPKIENVFCDEPEATAVNQEQKSTMDQQLDSLCEQMKEMKMDHLQDDSKSVQEPVDQGTSDNILKRARENDEMDREKEQEPMAQKQKKQIAHEVFQEWLQAEHRRCYGQDPSSTERPEEIVSSN